MIIYKDKASLDAKFPFCIQRFRLKKKDNCEDCFHYHSFCEITYVESGRGNYYVNGQQYDMNPGDLIIFNNLEPHGWNVCSEDMQVLVMTFATELLSDPADIFSIDYLGPFLERGGNFCNKVEDSDPNTKTIYDILLEIYKEYQKKETGFAFMIKADALRILTYLIRHYQRQEAKGEEPKSLSAKKKIMKRLEEAFYYINTHYGEKITLEEVASLVYMSPNYFSGYFKKVTNSSFSEYLTKLRLKKAEELARSTDLSMAAIAMECGFRNMSNFYRLYKKHIGELPKRGAKTLGQGM